MSDRSITQGIGDAIAAVWRGFLKFLDDYDAQSWPAFGVFFAVVTLGMYMNYIAFQIVIGRFAAIMISLFFEFAILAWKMTTNRKRNDAIQNQLSNWATWLSVILAVSMLIVNLFRVGGEESFEYLSYIIVGAAACVQVVFYLFFDQANPDKKLLREHFQANRKLNRKEDLAHNVIGELEADVKIIRYIVNELKRIEFETQDLPIEQREYLLEAARQKLLGQYADGKDNVARATRGLSDLNRDGRIGYAAKPPPVIIPARDDRLEKIKEMPVDILFDEELPTDLPTVANEGTEPPATDF